MRHLVCVCVCVSVSVKEEGHFRLWTWDFSWKGLGTTDVKYRTTSSITILLYKIELPLAEPTDYFVKLQVFGRLVVRWWLKLASFRLLSLQYYFAFSFFVSKVIGENTLQECFSCVSQYKLKRFRSLAHCLKRNDFMPSTLLQTAC